MNGYEHLWLTGSGGLVTVSCGPFRRPIAGGFSGNATSHGPTANGWTVAGTGTLTAYVICMNSP